MTVGSNVRHRPEYLEALEQYGPRLARRAHLLHIALKDAVQELGQRLPADVAFELAADYREIRLLGVLLQAEPTERRGLLVTEGRLDDSQANAILGLLDTLAASPRLINALSWVQPSWFPFQDTKIDIELKRSSASPSGYSAKSAIQEPEKIKGFSWLHLSDLHIGPKSSKMSFLSELLSDIEKNFSSERQPDEILVTGDIVASGQSKEYDKAREFFDRLCQILNISSERIVFVPGNHDVNRTDTSRAARRLLSVLRAGLEPLEEAITDKEDWSLLKERMQAYVNFSVNYKARHTSLAWSERRRLNREGTPIRCIGLNSALLSTNEDDRGKLRLESIIKTYLSHLSNQLERVRQDEFVMVVSHHPFRGGWLADEVFCNSWLQNQAHVHLHGHEEQGGPFTSADTRLGTDSVVRIHAGRCKNDSYRYNYCELIRNSEGASLLRIWPRVWTEQSANFNPEELALGKKRLYAELRIPHSSPIQLNMESMQAAIESAKLPTERTRRQDMIALLQKNIEEVRRKELSADLLQLEAWLKELQQF